MTTPRQPPAGPSEVPLQDPKEVLGPPSAGSLWAMLGECLVWFEEEAEQGQGDTWKMRDKIKALFGERARSAPSASLSEALTGKEGLEGAAAQAERLRGVCICYGMPPGEHASICPASTREAPEPGVTLAERCAAESHGHRCDEDAGHAGQHRADNAGEGGADYVWGEPTAYDMVQQARTAYEAAAIASCSCGRGEGPCEFCAYFVKGRHALSRASELLAASEQPRAAPVNPSPTVPEAPMQWADGPFEEAAPLEGLKDLERAAAPRVRYCIWRRPENQVGPPAMLMRACLDEKGRYCITTLAEFKTEIDGGAARAVADLEALLGTHHEARAALTSDKPAAPQAPSEVPLQDPKEVLGPPSAGSPRDGVLWYADNLKQWECPKCRAGYDAGAGLVCEGDRGYCHPAVSTPLHGTHAEPCEEARCLRCGWAGTLGNAPLAAPPAVPALPSCTPMRCRIGLDFNHCEAAGHLATALPSGARQQEEEK